MSKKTYAYTTDQVRILKQHLLVKTIADSLATMIKDGAITPADPLELAEVWVRLAEKITKDWAANDRREEAMYQVEIEGAAQSRE